MTISSTNRIAGPFIGAGTTATFPFTFKVFAAADLEVVRVLVSTGAETPLALTTDYTVSLNGNQNTNPGGSITLVAGNLATGYNLVITSNVANTQPVDLTNQGGFYPEVINDALDRATIQIQQLNDTALNAVHAPVTDGALLMELPAAGIRANKYLAFDASGLPLVADGTSTPAVTSGGDLTFTVNDAGAGVAQDFIFVNDTTEVMRLKGATARLGIGTAAPTTALDVVGAGKFSGNLTVNTNTLFVDAANNRVGVLNATPAVALDVTGAAAVSGNVTTAGTVFINSPSLTNGRLATKHSTNSEWVGIFEHNNTSPFGMRVNYTGASPNGTTNQFIRCDDNAGGGTTRFQVLSNGTCQNTTGSYTTTSDLKIKEQVVDCSSQWSDIKAIRVVNYKLREDVARLGAAAPSMIGVIAQELEAVCPGLVYETDDCDGLNQPTGTSTKSVKQSIMYMKAVKALQEAMSRIESLEARIAILEAAP